MAKNISKRVIKEERYKIGPAESENFQTQNVQNYPKSKEEILKPYIQTIIVAVIVTLLSIYLLSNRDNEDSHRYNKIEKKDTNDSPKTSHFNKSNEDTNQKDKEVNKENAASLNEKKINIVISESFQYIESKEFSIEKSNELLLKLKSLYSIRGLSRTQNDQLLFYIKQIERIKRANSEEESNTNVVETYINNPKFHIIKENETLYRIKELYNISINDLIRMNPDKIGPNLKINSGDTLKLIYE